MGTGMCELYQHHTLVTNRSWKQTKWVAAIQPLKAMSEHVCGHVNMLLNVVINLLFSYNCNLFKPFFYVCCVELSCA